MFQLSSTKDKENKRDLLYFLADYIDNHFPELLYFDHEMVNVDVAARVCLKSLKESMDKMNSTMIQLNHELQIAAEEQADKDDM